MKIAIGLLSADSRACLPLSPSLLAIANAGFKRGIFFSEPSLGMSALLPAIRDVLADDALRSGADALLCVDQDQSFEPEDFFALLDPIERGMADVVGSAVGQKDYDPTRIRAASLNYERDVFRFAVGGYNFQPTGEKGFRLGRNIYLPADVGMGVMLISRKALVEAATVSGKFHDAVDPNDVAAKPVPILFEGPAEDLNFCRLVRKAGLRTLAHVNSSVLHWGLTAYQNNAVQLLREQGIDLNFPDASEPRAEEKTVPEWAKRTLEEPNADSGSLAAAQGIGLQNALRR